MRGSSHTLDRVEVTFDDDHAVADAGLVLVATLAGRRGVEAAADDNVGVGYRPGRKTLTLVHALVAGTTAPTTLGCCVPDRRGESSGTR